MSDDVAPVETMPSSVVERYLSRASHDGRMVFDITFELERPIDVDRLRESWIRTMECHPRMHAQLIGKGTHQTWHVGKATPDVLFADVPFDGDTDSNAVPTPCVRRGAGAILLHSSNPEWPAIRFRFHHGACDGVGATRIVGDFLCDLHGIRHRNSSEDAANRAAKESVTSGGGPLKIPDLRNTWSTIKGRNVRFDRHVVARGSNELMKTADHEPAPRLIAADTIATDLTTDNADWLRERLRGGGIPLNDFAVAAVLRALGDASNDAGSNKTFLMVMNPVHMRHWKDRRSTANHVGFAYVRRRHDQVHDGLLDSVHQELDSVRQHGTAGELSWGIGAVEGVPGILPLIERRGWFTPTASLTCISMLRYGRRYGFDRGAMIGGSPVTRFGITAPIQARGELAITIWDIGTELGWSVRAAAKDVASRDAARQLALRLRQLSGPQSPLVA
ncbi:MAG: hypothetical protein AAFX06_03115 [Planctomycetota bacterium]